MKTKLLIVDDEKDFLHVLKSFFSFGPYDVQTATSSEKALHLLDQIQFDVVVTDMDVRNGLARPTVYPTGTTIFNPTKAQDGVFIMAVHPEYVAIIDRNGNEYNRWNIEKNHANARARLIKNGNLLLASTYIDLSGSGAFTESHQTIIRELTWDGKKVWEYTVPKELDWHNDVIKLKNGNILFTAYTPVPKEYLAKIKDVDIPWWGAIKRSKANMRT